jgi:hypothetical protein
MAHCHTREGKWRGNWWMDWVATTLYTTSEHGVSTVTTITTADVHTSAASSRLNWRPCQFKWTRPFCQKDEIWFLHVCHHISNAVYWVNVSQHFKGTCCLFLQGQAVEQYCCSVGTRFLLKFVSPSSTASLCTRPESSVMPLRESQVTKINSGLHLVNACCLLSLGIFCCPVCRKLYRLECAVLQFYLIYLFIIHLLFMWDLFCYTQEGLQPAGVWEHCAEENVWT